MKNLMLLTSILLFIGLPIVQAQTPEINTVQTPQSVYDFHIKKRKANKLAAWIALGSGVAMFVSGFAINMDQPYFGEDASSNDNAKGLWLSYVGAATSLTSIPLFIASGKHTRKAQLQLDRGAVGLIKPLQYTGIGVVFSF